MGLTSAFHIGRSALSASQLGIQIASNNIANASTAGYSREVASFTPVRGDQSPPGAGVGRGVAVRDVLREVDTALLQRYWQSNADESGARVQSQIYSQIEAALGELGQNDLSSEFAGFFRTWSERSNQTSASAVVVQQGDRLAAFMRRLRNDLSGQLRTIDAQLGSSVERANGLIRTVADLNRQIADAEVSGGQANPLRDQRDQAITQLSSMMDVTVVQQSRQGVDVLVGSTPIVLAGVARPIEVRREQVDGVTRTSVCLQGSGEPLDVRSGEVGAMLNGQRGSLTGAIDTLDRAAAQLAFEVNRLHSTGRNLSGLTATTGTLALSSTDRALALNDPNNVGTRSLPYAASNGSFSVVVRNTATGGTRTVRVNVDLDGLNNAGRPSTAQDTTAEDIRAALDAVDGLSATFTPDGKLDLRADSGFDFSFADDSSGALALLGVNAFFTGTDAATLDVRADLKNDPTRLTAGRVINGEFVENGTALEIARLQDRPLESLGGRSITQAWRDAAQAIGVDAAGAKSRADAAGVVRDSLDAQRQALSGVSLDEEAINLLNFQRQYQGAAKVISVADELMKTLIQLI